MTQSASATLAALPDTRHEDWRYTDLAPLKARAWSEQAPESASIVFDGAAPLTQTVRLAGPANGARLQTHRISLRPHQQATLLLHELGDGAPFLAMHNLEITLAENSALNLYRIQQPGAATSLISHTVVRLARDARFHCVGLYAGGLLVRNDLNVSLAAPGAQAELHGLLMPAPGEHLDVHTRLDHRAEQTRSRETFRCIVPGGARAIFNGKVIVHQDACKTDSEQQVDSLLLAAGAEVNAKPELQIDNDDVKCAHGATCGQLDENAIYYLRSRGLSLESARGVLLHAFADEVLRRIPEGTFRQEAERRVQERLP